MAELESRREALERYAGKYPALVREHGKQFSVHCPVFEGMAFRSDNLEAALKEMRTAIANRLEEIAAEGRVPPVPGVHGKRQVQVNCRLTAAEMDLFKRASKLLGYSSVSGFIRDAAFAEIFERETGLPVNFVARKPGER